MGAAIVEGGRADGECSSFARTPSEALLGFS